MCTDLPLAELTGNIHAGAAYTVPVVSTAVSKDWNFFLLIEFPHADVTHTHTHTRTVKLADLSPVRRNSQLRRHHSRLWMPPAPLRSPTSAFVDRLLRFRLFHHSIGPYICPYVMKQPRVLTAWLLASRWWPRKNGVGLHMTPGPIPADPTRSSFPARCDEGAASVRMRLFNIISRKTRPPSALFLVHGGTL
jgi:hypothetical protein